jgi:hypothetical protein
MSLPGKIRLWLAYNAHLGIHPQPKRVLFSWLERQTKMQVAQGPFRGMRLVPASFGSSLMPKMLGTYELEIRQDIEDMLGNEYCHFMDVGAAEGYYAVGVAMRMAGRGTKTYAYDISPHSAPAIRQAAEMNGVTQGIEMRQWCRHADFEMARRGRTLILCDIEGAEAGLLDPALAPDLARCDVVVEVHDGPESSRISELLKERFRHTHTIVARHSRPRAHHDLGAYRWRMPKQLGAEAMNEGRTFGIEWLILRAKTPSAQP